MNDKTQATKEQYQGLCDRLRLQASAILNNPQSPFDHLDVGSAYLREGANALLSKMTAAEAVHYLREFASTVERDQQAAPQLVN